MVKFCIEKVVEIKICQLKTNSTSQSMTIIEKKHAMAVMFVAKKC